MSREITSQLLGSSAGEISIAIKDILILGVAAVILAFPMLMYGPMVNGHDTYEHLNYCRHFGEQFWRGELYPRWLQGMNHGLGSPTFFVFPPFPSYVYALLQPLGTWFHFNAFNAGEFLALLSSGIFSFLWIETIASRRVALASAVLYMLMSYHLSVDFYRRTALPECWALAWMPLVLYFAAPTVIRKRGALLGVAFAYALLILSHLVSVAIFSLIPLAVALALSPRAERFQLTLRVTAGMALGVGLSCFYFLSALFHARYFPVTKILTPPYYVLADHFITLTDLIGKGSRVGFVHWVSLGATSMIMFMTICGGVVLLKGNSDSRQSVIFWCAVCVVPVFLMAKVSLSVWKHFPMLSHAVQYPWRLNIVLCLAALPVGAHFLTKVSLLSKLQRSVVLGLVGVVVLVWVISYGQIWKRYKTDVTIPRLSVSPRFLVDDDDGWFEAWSVADLDQASALKASAGPRVRFLGVAGTSDVLDWKSRHIEFWTDSQTGGWVMINQFYYPAWTASPVGAMRPLAIKAAMPEGLMEVEVPPGHQQIGVNIPTGSAERAGRWISAASLLLCAVLVWKKV